MRKLTALFVASTLALGCSPFARRYWGNLG